MAARRAAAPDQRHDRMPRSSSEVCTRTPQRTSRGVLKIGLQPSLLGNSGSAATLTSDRTRTTKRLLCERAHESRRGEVTFSGVRSSIADSRVEARHDVEVDAFLGWINRWRAAWMTTSIVVILISVVLILVSRSGIGWGDAPGGAAFVVSIVGTWIAAQSARSSKVSAAAAETSAQATVRQAAAAEEQNVISRQALHLAQQQAQTGATPGTELIQEALAPAPVSYVAWWIEQRSKNAYALRNIGTTVARNVEIDQSRIKCVVRGAATADKLAPNASIEILLIPMMGAPKPNELWIRWKDHPEWHAARMP